MKQEPTTFRQWWNVNIDDRIYDFVKHATMQQARKFCEDEYYKRVQSLPWDVIWPKMEPEKLHNEFRMAVEMLQEVLDEVNEDSTEE